MAAGLIPSVLLVWVITALLLSLGWLSLVEGLQGSDHVVVHVYEVFFQGKGIGERELSHWRIIFGVVIFLAGAVFWTVANMAILVKAIVEAVSEDSQASLSDT